MFNMNFRISENFRIVVLSGKCPAVNADTGSYQREKCWNGRRLGIFVVGWKWPDAILPTFLMLKFRFDF